MLNAAILILSVILDLHSTTDASACIHLWPYNPRAINGEPFNMWCSVLPGCSLTSSDLFFTYDEGVLVDQRLVAVLNSTTVRLTFPRISVSLNQEHLYCMQRINGSSEDMPEYDVQLLSVGYRPFMPSIRKDYKVFNWEYFEFNWTISNTDTVYNTNYAAWFRRSVDADFFQCGKERKRSRRIGGDTGRTCRILDALDFVHPNGMLFFKVNGSNAVDTVSTDVERADLNHIIQPGPVKNMTVVSSVKNGVELTFYAPKKEKRLKYNISVHCGSTSWNVSTSKQGSPSQVKLHLPFPPFTNCSLSISCLPYHNRQYWSEPSEAVVFTSPDAVPLMSPDICCIAIEQSTLEFRNVTVYFKKLKDEEARGKVTRYHYNFTSSRSDHRLPYSTEQQLPPNATSMVLELYRDTTSVVRLTAETRAGLNHSIASSLSIPSEENIPLKDEEAHGKVTKYHYNLTSSRSDHRLASSTGKQLPPNSTSLTLELCRDTNYVVKLTAETRAGLNHSIASSLSIPSEENILHHPRNATAIWHEPGTMRISWSKIDNEFNSIVVWCHSSTCKGSVDWKKTKSTFYDVELPQKDIHHRFGIASASSDGNRISAIEWIRCIYDFDKVAKVPRVSVINKTSRSICLWVKPEEDCASGDQGYIYEYRIEYGNGKKMFSVTKPASDSDVNGEYQFQFPDLIPESNYTFSVVAMTAKGSSEKFVLSEWTDSTGALEQYQLILIIIACIVGFVLIAIGIYTCCKWNSQLVMKVRRWFHPEIKVPDKVMAVERGMADGDIISSSYTSLSKRDAAVPLQSQHCDLNHPEVKSEEQSISETAFLAPPNDKNSAEAENSSDIKISNSAKKAKHVKSSSHPSSFHQGSTSNPGSTGSPPKSSSAGHVNQSTSAGCRVEFVDERGTQQRNLGEDTNHHPPRQSTSRELEISGSNQENIESGTQSTTSARQSDALNRNSETNDPLDGNNFITVDNEHEIEIDEYSNVRLSSDGRDEPDEIQTTPDSYSRARLPSGEDAEDDDSYGRDYSRALLMDDNNLGVSDEPPGRIDGNFSSEEDDRHDDVNYSTASMIRKSNC